MAFDAHVRGRDDASPHRVRWVLTRLKKLKDDYAAAPLVECPPCMNIDPRCIGDYVSLGLGAPRVVDGIMAKLDQLPEESTHALDLHLWKAMSTRTFGRDEGAIAERVAGDGSRPAPVRAWACQALATTPRYKARAAMEVAIAEEDEATFSDLAHTTRWVDAA